MKRKSPPFFSLGVAGLLLSLVFLSNAFAGGPEIVKTKKFGVWSAGDPDKHRESGDTGELTAENRDRSGNDNSDSSSSVQRGSGMGAREDESGSASQVKDEDLPIQERSVEFEEYQKFLESLREDLARFNWGSGLKRPFNLLKGGVAQRLYQEHQAVTYNDFVHSSAESEPSAAVSKWKTQQKDYEAFKQKVDEACAAHLRGDDMLMNFKIREADCLDALSQLRFDTTPALDSMRGKLMEAYQKILSCRSIESANFNLQTLSPEQQKIYQDFLKLGDEVVRALAEGRTHAVDALEPLMKQQQTFLTQPASDLKPLLLRAEAKALLMKIKAEPAMGEIIDEEMASFPWDFESPYCVTLNVLQRIQDEGNLETSRAVRLQALRKKLAGERVTSLSSTRPVSQFPVTFPIENERASELKKLQGPSYRTGVIVEAEEWVKKLKDVLSCNRQFNFWQMRRNNNKDPLLSLLEGQIRKAKSVSSQSDEVFLKAIEATKLLYPYVEKKIELCKQFMKIGPNEWHYQYSNRLEPFWSSMSAETNSVFTQLDGLAASRLLAEQTIAERGEPYLTHALDGIRSEDEEKFQRDLNALLATEPRVERILQQTRSFCSLIGEVAAWTMIAGGAYCLLFALYLQITAVS